MEVKAIVTKAKVAITGSAGLQGSRLCQRLAELGHQIVAVDHRGGCPPFDHENIEHFVMDCGQAGAMMGILEGCAVVFHLAAHFGGHDYIRENAFEVFSDNVGMDLSVFRTCVTLNIPRVIYPSSGCVYSRSSPQDSYLERDAWWPTTTPDCRYGWGKLISEMALEDAPLPTRVVLRLFSVYGDATPQRDGQVVPDLIEKVVRAGDGDTVDISGDGTPKRSFLFVEDAVDAYIAAMTEPLAGLNTINIGHRETTSIRELAESIVFISGKDLDLRFGKEPGGTPSKLPNIDRAEALLGWEPKTPLMDGLLKTYRFYEKDLR